MKICIATHNPTKHTAYRKYLEPEINPTESELEAIDHNARVARELKHYLLHR